MIQKTPDPRPDVIVIGGGPSGTTAASVLADHGHRVLILEKEKFPRFSIGESLIPYCYFTLERIGMVDKMERSHFQRKHSVQFVSSKGEASQPFYFGDHFDHPAAATWQVLRSEFDQMMLDHAREKGVVVLEETRVQEFIREEDRTVKGVRAITKEGQKLEFEAPITIDASGRGGLGLSRNKWRIPDPKLKKIAIWTYYKGAKRDSGRDEGATTVGFLPEGGWFWYIPLADDVVSVGAVAERDYLFRDTRDLAEIFDREVENNDWIRKHLAPGTRINAPGVDEGPMYITSEWSYTASRCADDGLVLAGDALGFLDPIFSSGVLLALKGGELVGDAVHEALEAKDISAARFVDYGRQMASATDAMKRLVYAFYDEAFSMRGFLERHPHLQSDVTDCLIGNLSRDFGELFEAVDRYASAS